MNIKTKQVMISYDGTKYFVIYIGQCYIFPWETLYPLSRTKEGCWSILHCMIPTIATFHRAKIRTLGVHLHLYKYMLCLFLSLRVWILPGNFVKCFECHCPPFQAGMHFAWHYGVEAVHPTCKLFTSPLVLVPLWLHSSPSLSSVSHSKSRKTPPPILLLTPVTRN